MTYHFQNPDQETIFNYLKDSKTIAVVGLSNRQESPAYRVSEIMQKAGYKIIPVNPKQAGKIILGELTYASLKDIPETIDIVNVFRRSDFLPEVAKEFITTDARIFWAQLGLENEEAEQILRDNHRNDIVMNRCIKIEYFNM
ncbi:CoA-binding protein [Streptococcus zalophi]|uniref:CoA-binding protein n=1 Tax=Streptococcus zalophi TaxID=640031 RepID=A0A934PB99_9STRE|nr:CoA-binding protein [Streptococcus zalophi]MBJ8350440.1 CoA-binding protein [Streptococcus zalophi]MCR8966911.1 CoA-binding protein [Streptococcus zalophi]